MDWEAIIKRGVESDVLDYKSAQNWNNLSKAGRAKFARHCMALANTKGGYVVVGVSEDPSGKPALFTGLTEEESHSFDPTNIGNFVNRYSDPQVEFTVERPEVDGKRYVVFDIKRFRHLPHVCTCTCDHELLQGVFYIRTTDASSRPAYRASEVLDLVQRAMRNQREELGRVIRGLLYENHLIDSTAESQSRFAEELQHSRAFFNKRVRPSDKDISFEFALAPTVHQEDRFSLTELRSAAEKTCSAFTHFLNLKDMDALYATNASIREAGPDHIMQIYKSGLFHYKMISTQTQEISCKWLSETITCCSMFASLLFNQLGLNHNDLELQLSMDHVNDVKLSGYDNAVCRIPEIVIRQHYGLSASEQDIFHHIADLIQSVYERFNIALDLRNVLEKQIRDSLNIR